MKYIKRFFSSIFISLKMFFTGFRKDYNSELSLFEDDKVWIYEKHGQFKIFVFKKDKVTCFEESNVLGRISRECLILKVRFRSNGDVRLLVYDFSSECIKAKCLPYEIYGDDSTISRVQVFDKEGYEKPFGKIFYVIETKDKPSIFTDEACNVLISDVLSYRFVKKAPTVNEYLLTYLGLDHKFYIVDNTLKKSSGYEMLMFGNENQRSLEHCYEENFTRHYTLPLIAVYKDDCEGTTYNLITKARVLDLYEEYDKIYPSKDSNYLLARDLKGKYGYLDMNGRKVTTFDFSYLSPVTHGRCFARRGTSSFILYDVEHDKEHARVYKRIYHDFKEVLYGCVTMELALVETYEGIFYIDREDKKYEIVSKEVTCDDECYLTI